MKIRRMPYFFLMAFNGFLEIISAVIMTFLLLILLAMQLVCILYLSHKLVQERNRFRSKLKPMEAFMLQLSQEQEKQSLQVQLSEELQLKMKEVNSALSRNIFELNYQLMEDTYPKKEI